MQWPYHLVDLSSSQKHERRVLLNRYGVYAQLSPLVPILVYRLYRLAVWVYLERRRAKAPYDAVPSSPRLKHAKLARSGALRRRWRSAVWWLDGEVREGWGERRLWVLGMIWALWMGVLCVRETGDGMFVLHTIVVRQKWQGHNLIGQCLLILVSFCVFWFDLVAVSIVFKFHIELSSFSGCVCLNQY